MSEMGDIKFTTAGEMLRTQPQDIIARLEADNSRLAKEAILAEAMQEGLDEFFEGVRMALDKLYTFGVKQVPEIDPEWNGQGLQWKQFVELATSLHKREFTGNAAQDAIRLASEVATAEQWNGFYRRILIKDLRCGVSEKTVNNVAKKQNKEQYKVPVFECMLAHDSAKHEKKIGGKVCLDKKLDGVRVLTVVDGAMGEVVSQFTRNGKTLQNFTKITQFIRSKVLEMGNTRPMVLDGEIVSNSFQDLMKQVHRKDNVEADDAVLQLFDIIPLSEFKQGASVLNLRQRHRMLEEYCKMFEGFENIQVIPKTEVDLGTPEGQQQFKDFNKEAIDQGYEGIMIKNPTAKYECKRSTGWLKQKPFIEVSLEVKHVEEGTGRNEGKLGAFVCEGTDDGKKINVNVGSGFTDVDRDNFWSSRDSIPGNIVEVRADAITQNQDGTYSLRFPRFKTFRGFEVGEKI
jgi:DNA ligase-1